MSERRARRMRRRAGLTLIEVMLTMVVLGLAGVVLITATSQALGVVRAARLYNHAYQLLNRIELEHPLFDEDVEEGEEQGSFRDTGLGTFRWTRSIAVVGEEEDDLFEVRTRVSWSQRGRTGYEEVVTYRHVPQEEL
jgi:prepilin-type N-terminal cleavage/methylation domain-containing protein